MSVKGDWQSIVGRTIKAVVVSSADRAPQTQVFLVFGDGLHLEIYSQHLAGTNHLYEADVPQILAYLGSEAKVTVYSAEGAASGQ